MNKAEIITELENMVVDRLFGPQPWLADGQTSGTIRDKLIEMGLLEVVCLEPVTWRPTPLGNELDVALFKVFFGTWCKWEVPGILSEGGPSRPDCTRPRGNSATTRFGEGVV